MAVVKRNSVVLSGFGEIVPQQFHIAFVFTKLHLVAWRDIRPLIQRRAAFFAYNPDKTAAYAGFVVTPDNCRKVSEICSKVYSMKGVFVHVAGTDTETMHDVSPWIHCWLESFAFQNKGVYCSVCDYDPELYTGVTGYRDYLDKPVSESEWRITLPCKCAWPDRLRTDHPETFVQQCLDTAKAKGCDRCPLFDIARFQVETVKERRSKAIRLTGSGLYIDVKKLLEE